MNLAKRTTSVAALLAFALVVTGCGGDDGEDAVNTGATAPTGQDSTPAPAEDNGQTFELEYSMNAGPTHMFSESMAWFAEQVEERTDGRVVINLNFSSTLCALEEVLACVRDGRADLGNVAPLANPAEMPLSSVATLPFVSSSPPAYAEALGELFEDNEALRAEWQAQNQMPLAVPIIPEAWMGTTRPIEGLDDMNGLRIRATGLLAEALAAVGADPVAVSSTELYEGLERNVLDAWLAAIDFGTEQSLHEVTDHWYDLTTGVYAVTANPAINLDTFNSMPADIQEVMVTTAHEMQANFFADYYEPAQEAACETMAEAGVEVGALPDDVIEEMRTYTEETLVPGWIQRAQEAGADDPAAFLDALREKISEIEPEWEGRAVSALERCRAASS